MTKVQRRMVLVWVARAVAHAATRLGRLEKLGKW